MAPLTTPCPFRDALGIVYLLVFLNSLLATLNAREKLRRGGLTSNGLVSIPLASSSARTNSTSTGTRAQIRGDAVRDTPFRRTHLKSDMDVTHSLKLPNKGRSQSRSTQSPSATQTRTLNQTPRCAVLYASSLPHRTDRDLHLDGIMEAAVPTNMIVDDLSHPFAVSTHIYVLVSLHRA